MPEKEHPISGLMEITLEKLRQMVDSNTIIGQPVNTPDCAVIIPVSKVSFGFASGGSDFAAPRAPAKDLFGGGSGAGVSISPVAFLVVKDGDVRLIQLNEGSGGMDRVLSMLPEVIEKVQGFVSGKKGEKAKGGHNKGSGGEGPA